MKNRWSSERNEKPDLTVSSFPSLDRGRAKLKEADRMKKEAGRMKKE
ncbi:MAG: hypothetical protein IK000_01120 [Bacteroidaceae bacterium]|nr:hypothetical protein [Bacteroidaceae bacterium]